MRAAATLATVVVVACIASAASAAGSATGKLCGASGCIALPRPLALRLSEQDDAFYPAQAPRPAPYYKIVIHATGEEHINRTILWVPSKRVWFDAKDLTPPLPGSWRSEGVKKDFPGLFALEGKVKLYPAPRHWVLPSYE